MRWFNRVLLLALFGPTLALGQSLGPPGGGSSGPAYTPGTWTPVVTASTTAGTPTYSVQVGSYEAIGRLVVARFTVSLSAWAGTPAGNVQITGLPLTSNSASNDLGMCTISYYTIAGVASDLGVSGYINPGTSIINLVLGTQTGTVLLSTAAAGSTPQLYGSCLYRT